MKVKSFLIIGLLSLIMLSGCSSFYPEKVSSSECLIVIPTEFHKSPGTDNARSYYLNISGSDKSIKVPTSVSNKVYIKVSSAEGMIDTITSRVTNPDYKGDPYTIDAKANLPYSAGQLIVANFKIVQTIELTKARTSKSDINFLPLDDAERVEILKDLKDDPSFSTWF